MRKMKLEKNAQAVVSVKPNQVIAFNKMATDFKGVELDFSDHLSNKAVRAALNACEWAGLDVKAVHLPNPKRLAKMIGARKIPEPLLDLQDTVFVFHAWMKGDEQERSDLCRLAEKIAGHSNSVAIENVSNQRKIFSNPNEVSEYFSRPRPFGFCLDTSHPVPRCNQASTATILAFVKAAGANLTHVHLSDADLADGRKHLPLGKGKIEWRMFFDALRSNNYRGLLALELEGAILEDFRESLQVLSNYGISTESSSIVPLLSIATPEDAASSICRFVGEEVDGLAGFLAKSRNLFMYSDEHNRLFFFDRSGAECAPLLRQLDFPKEVPNGSGFVAVVSDAYRIDALYYSREEKIAVRRTLQHIYRNYRNSIMDFLEDIKNAMELSFGSSSVTRMMDGQII